MCPNWTKALNLAMTKTSKEDVLFHVPPSMRTHLSRYTLLVPADPAVSLSSARDVENTRSWIGTALVCHTHVCLPLRVRVGRGPRLRHTLDATHAVAFSLPCAVNNLTGAGRTGTRRRRPCQQ